MILQTIRTALQIFAGVISNSYSINVINELSRYRDEFTISLKDLIRIIEKKNWKHQVPMITKLIEIKH